MIFSAFMQWRYWKSENWDRKHSRHQQTNRQRPPKNMLPKNNLSMVNWSERQSHGYNIILHEFMSLQVYESLRIITTVVKKNYHFMVLWSANKCNNFILLIRNGFLSYLLTAILIHSGSRIFFILRIRWSVFWLICLHRRIILNRCLIK